MPKVVSEYQRKIRAVSPFEDAFVRLIWPDGDTVLVRCYKRQLRSRTAEYRERWKGEDKWTVIETGLGDCDDPEHLVVASYIWRVHGTRPFSRTYDWYPRDRNSTRYLTLAQKLILFPQRFQHVETLSEKILLKSLDSCKQVR